MEDIDKLLEDIMTPIIKENKVKDLGKLNKVVDILEGLGFTTTGSIFLYRLGLLDRKPKDIDIVIKDKKQLQPLLDGGKFDFYKIEDKVYFDQADKLVRLSYEDIKVDFFIKEDSSYTLNNDLHIKEILKYKFEIMLNNHNFNKTVLSVETNKETFDKHYNDIKHIFK